MKKLMALAALLVCVTMLAGCACENCGKSHFGKCGIDETKIY